MNAIDHQLSPEQKREFLMSTIRCVRARLQAKVCELDEIGVSLRHNMIDAEAAVTWLYHIGADRLVNLEPWPTKIEAAA